MNGSPDYIPRQLLTTPCVAFLADPSNLGIRRGIIRHDFKEVADFARFADWADAIAVRTHLENCSHGFTRMPRIAANVSSIESSPITSTKCSRLVITLPSWWIFSAARSFAAFEPSKRKRMANVFPLP